MLNSNKGVTKKSYGNVNQILADVDGQHSFGCIVANTGITAVDGKKIMKAGTPLAGNLAARQTPFTAVLTGVTGVVGVLLHDVDVTDGNNNGTILYRGSVNINRMESDIAALYNSAMTAALRPLGITAVKAN